MTRNCNPVGWLFDRNVLALPDVAKPHRAAEAKLAKVYVDLHRMRMAIKQAHRLGSIRKRLRPDLDWTLDAYPVALNTLGVLIDGDNLSLFESCASVQ